jgi:peptidoglycan/LPS O-acetylase OafA/YrhL
VGVMFVCLPFVFAFQKGREWDSKIGELSYPLYLIHWPVMILVQRAFQSFGREETLTFSITTTAAALVAAWVVNAAIAEPVERLRDAVRAGRSLMVRIPRAAT